MVKVVVPLRIQTEAAGFPGSNHAGVVEGAFSDAVYAAIQPFGLPVDLQRKLFQEGARGKV